MNVQDPAWLFINHRRSIEFLPICVAGISILILVFYVAYPNNHLPLASAAKVQDPLPKQANSQSARRQQDGTIFATDFSNGLTIWEFSDASAWNLEGVEWPKVPAEPIPSEQKPNEGLSPPSGKPTSGSELSPLKNILRLHRKKSNYQPAVRSPLHQAILKEHVFGSFEMNVDVRSTHPDYGHRDVCFFFGYQSPSEFYYVHLGKVTDPHCNQIFVVNKADRKKISLTTNKGTPWDDQWHRVRIVRDLASDSIEVYFDDEPKPSMTASDKTFSRGRVGLGSFDDTADFANFRVSELAAEDD